MNLKVFIAIAFGLIICNLYTFAQTSRITGHITDDSNNAISLATVALEGTQTGVNADVNGFYDITVPSGEHILVVSAVGYTTSKNRIIITAGTTHKQNISLYSDTTQLDEIIISEKQSVASRIRRTAYNVTAIETKHLLNSSMNLSDALAKVPGLKLRESGGVGSEVQMMLDGFSGKHVKVFIDGVPLDGVGNEINNIPVNFAERIEVYRGVVPIHFGTDAMGGVINIVTNRHHEGWKLDVSYSYGSFNTHKSSINFANVLKKGIFYEVNAFQNYSDNDYHIDAPIEDFETGRIEKKKLHKVQRFNDNYHNEAIVSKIGITDKKWADKLMLELTYSQMHKDIQTGVRQEIVYGKKHRKGHSIIPLIEYSKRNLLVSGLDVAITAKSSYNSTTNIDTSSYKFNWLGETKRLNSPGEQSLLHTRSENNRKNITFTTNYRLKNSHAHTFSLHYAFDAFERSNTSLLTTENIKDAISKKSRKNIINLSYRLMPYEKWNFTVFGKYYNIGVEGPMPTTSNNDKFVKEKRNIDSYGYGFAGTYFITRYLQTKISYEKAIRLPSIEEIFGDEDLETGYIGIKPERSNNINFNLSYNKVFDNSSLYTEGGIVYRDTHDYIQRNIIDLSGGRSAATYINYGKVLTKGYNISLRYTLGKWLSVGGNFTQMDVLDNMKYAIGSSAPNLGYKEKMPNLPSVFANFDIAFNVNNFFGKDNLLHFKYESMYVEKFSYYSAKIGANKDEYMVPDQFSHNIMLTYSLQNGRYNFSLECRNITDERLYDNFSLQKAGRAFYGKMRICLGK